MEHLSEAETIKTLSEAELEIISKLAPIGRALLKILDKRLYRETHKTFASYCRYRWKMNLADARTAMRAAKIAAKERRGKPKLGAIAPNFDRGRATEIAAKRAGFTSRESYERATTVVEKGAPELVAAMDDGRLSINAAAKIASQPKDEQRRIITYEDRRGHVAYISYLDTVQFERAAALRLLDRSIQADQQTYLALKSGNEFADSLVATYGDLPLAELIRRHNAGKAAIHP